ncbi:trypsin alpha-3-like [Chrysoperla carnea]|uniref:trypsin alpha-3-like n=1 Tax=Chrysoperla carnea TaxID=189513 RepID=UPI001D0675B8|nr:trypsin alpha-3-like [Chrysoperla carnea]
MMKISMRILCSILVYNFWYLFCTIRASENSTETNLKGRIVSGDEASPGQFPYQIVLFLNGAQHCGGTIIDANHVVTAAHCLFHHGDPIKPYELLIKAGHISLNNETIQEYPVIKVITHKKFKSKIFLNDIGILQVGIRFQLENGVLEAVALERNTIADGTTCLVSGWGIQKQNTTIMPETLHYAEVQIINRKKCNTMYGDYMKIYKEMLCAANEKNFADACDGDSGGPLVCANKLVGIVSCGLGCGLPPYPGVYTNVAKYHSWITSIID